MPLPILNPPELIDRFDALLKTLNLPAYNDRFHQAAKVFSDLPSDEELEYMGSSEREEFFILLVYAYDNLIKIGQVIDYIDLKIDDKKLLKRKIKELCAGNISPLDEDSSTVIARNTQFELLLMARLRAAGLSCVLQQDNPDILLTVNGREYGIEAKRLSSTSDRSIERNTKGAASQLRNSFLEDDEKKRGIIALSVDKYINSQAVIAAGATPFAIRAINKQMTDDFQAKCVPYTTPQLIKHDRIVELFIDFNTLAWLESQNEPMTLETISHTAISASYRENFHRDINAPLTLHDLEMQRMMLTQMGVPEEMDVFFNYPF